MGREHFRPPSFHPNRPLLVSPVRIDPTGRTGPTRKQARGRHWRAAWHGWYVPAAVERTPEQRIVEAAVLLRPRGGAVTGWAALRWLGAQWFTGSTVDDPAGSPVPLTPCGDIRKRLGVTVCEEGLPPEDVMVVDGLPVTVPVRSVVFAMRYAPSEWDAVQVFDMAAYDDLVSHDEVAAYGGLAPRQGLSSWTGIPLFRKALRLGHENAWSPREVVMALVWEVVADLPRPLLNQPVFDLRGRHVATPDLLDVEAGVVGEYEGGQHLEGARRSSDVRREEALRDLGLECFTTRRGDAADPAAMARRMRSARRRALWQPPADRAWTIEYPLWWIPTVTVAQRRALTPEQRLVLLRHRRVA